MLLGAYSPFNRLPLRARTGTTTAGASFAFSPSNYNVPGWSHMIWQAGASIALPQIGYPSGYYNRGWKLPLGKSATTTKLQFLSGISALITFGGSAVGVKGRPAVGSATITINADGTAGLVVTGIGNADFTINASADIIGKLLAEGLATFEITAEGDTLEGLGWPVGNATITITADGQQRGIGWMEGTTGYTTTLTTQLIADAVWDEVMSGHVDPGSFGKFVQKLLSVSKFLGLK